MERPLEKSSEADRIHAPFRNQDSDFLTLLAVWNRYHHFLEKMGTQNQMRKFCREHFLSFNRMREWIFIHQQIISILKEQRMPHETSSSQRKEADVYSSIHISILSGLLSNIARKKQKNLYLAAREKEVMLFPGSSLFNRPPQWIVAAGMVKTSRIFARTAARIEPQWIEDLAGPLC
jgi:ATP-dependent helicase HrpA